MKAGRSDPTLTNGGDPEAPAILADGSGGHATPHPSGRRPGRPLEVSPEEVLGSIRWLAGRDEGLFRIHRAYPALYARARRLFGSWFAAVHAAGVDYAAHQGAARARSIRSRRRGRRPRGPRAEP